MTSAACLTTVLYNCLCSDLEHCSPPDFMGQPDDFLPAITSQPVREWALALHAIWPQLCRQVSWRVLDFVILQ